MESHFVRRQDTVGREKMSGIIPQESKYFTLCVDYMLFITQGGGTQMFAVLRSSSSVKVHSQAKISLDL